MWFESFIFYIAAAFLLSSGLMVILSKNTVYAALYLVLAFIASSVLWLLLESEFLALVLVLVYVGAVMTLFLFVVMMINLDVDPQIEGFVKYIPVGLVVMALVVGAMIFVLGPQHLGLANVPMPPPAPANYSNVSAIGQILYTHYVYPFELAAVLLLAAIIAAVSLSLRRTRSKLQNTAEQIKAKPLGRVRLVKK